MKFQSVCKHWLGLIRSPHFIDLHSNHPKNRDKHVLLLRLSIGGSPNEPEFKYESDRRHTVFQFCSFDHNGSICKVAPDYVPDCNSIHSMSGSCDGIIVCVSYRYQPEQIYLWNPATRETRTVPPCPYEDPPNHDFILVGFGFDSRANAYKVLRVLVPWMDTGYEDPTCLIDVYNFSSNSWREATTTTFHPQCEGDDGVVFLHGSYHWVAQNNGDYKREPIIAVFDMSLEVVGSFKYPDSEAFLRSRSRLMVLDGFLGMSVTTNRWDVQNGSLVPQFITVWVMTEYEVDSSWSKKCTIGPLFEDEYIDTLACWNSEKLLVENTNSVDQGRLRGWFISDLTSCDILREEAESDIPQMKRHGIVGYGMKALSYKESLVPLDHI